MMISYSFTWLIYYRTMMADQLGYAGITGNGFKARYIQQPSVYVIGYRYLKKVTILDVSEPY